MKLSDEFIKQLENLKFIRQHDGDSYYFRECEIFIPENQAVDWMDPESFSLVDVYGKCELAQMMHIVNEGKEAVVTPVIITKHEFEKNQRSFEEVADKAALLSKSATSAETNCSVI